MESEAAAELRVMTFNIRNTNAPDGPNRWNYRKDLWTATVRAFDPDLLGVQEVLADQYDQLRTLFPDYGRAGVARGDGVRKDEWALILYRADRFDEIGRGDFWLSETPDVVGSRSWDSACVRICSWAKLRDRRGGRTLLFANTHFDHESAAAPRESAKLIRSRLSALAAGHPVILTGDFNCDDESEPYHALVGAADGRGILLRDSYRTVHPAPSNDEASYHGFTGATAGRRIDWILHTPDLTPTEATIVRGRTSDGRFPSDHYPVVARFRWI